MTLDFNSYFDKYKKLAEKACSCTDKAQKKTALENLLGKIDELICEPISDNLQEIQNYTGFDFRNFQHVIFKYGGRYEKLITFVDSNIQEIMLFENDSMEKQQERKVKSDQLRQCIIPKEKVVRRVVENTLDRLAISEEKEMNPDWIYSVYGTYTQYLEFKTHKYFPICLNIKKSGCPYFKTTNHFVLLYVALNNELQMLNEELELFGMLNAPEVETEQHKTETDNPQEKQSVDKRYPRAIDADKLKQYFCAAFKGMGQNLNYFDTMIDELKTDRTDKEFAEIAHMIYHSTQMSSRKPKTFAKWYRIFCECIGIIKNDEYKPNKLKKPSPELKSLFSYL
jgi:hypothetical protein